AVALAMKVWNLHVLCDGVPAGHRAAWCVDNHGLSSDEARNRVIEEFPLKFGHPMWNPDLLCAGPCAEDRARWCTQNCGMAVDVAQEQIMREFSSVFEQAADDAISSWNPHVDCDGTLASFLAEQRQSDKISEKASKLWVMQDFASLFSTRSRWDPHIVCDGIPAGERAAWCVANLKISSEEARQRVMREFCTNFGEEAGITAVKVSEPFPDADAGALVWSDEFNYTGAPDPSKWSCETGGHGWGNGELQCYTDAPENVWVSDGALHIRALRKRCGERDFTSARLVTKGKGDFLYGRIEVRARVPPGRGTWAAVWMLPTDNKYGDWPACGEIDIMEHVGMDAGKVHGTIHTEMCNHKKGTQVGEILHVLPHEWHTYGVAWSHDRLNFFFDGRRYLTVSKELWASEQAWPFNKPFYLIMNLAVGGDWGGQQGIDNEAFEEGQTLELAYVRVYGST
ncbi:unnamed protein product, partial [Effrenium voratum]